MDREDNGENLFYKLNFRGLLLFLFNLSKLGLKKRVIRKQISEVLSNPKIEEMAPFLKYFDDFENAGFDVLYSLKEIAAELQNHHEDNTTGLSNSNMIYLIRRATEIYFIRVTNYFFFAVDNQVDFLTIIVNKRGLQTSRKFEERRVNTDY